MLNLGLPELLEAECPIPGSRSFVCHEATFRCCLGRLQDVSWRVAPGRRVFSGTGVSAGAVLSSSRRGGPGDCRAGLRPTGYRRLLSLLARTCAGA